MTDTFSLILAIITFITISIWCVARFKLLPFSYCYWLTIQQHMELSKILQNNQKIIHNVVYWINTICTLVFPVLIVLLVRSFILEPFQIPSGSMMPTLLVGDFILVDKFSYGIKNPITQKKLIKNGSPKRGDVVVFKYPLNLKLNYIKRVVGLPGDMVIYDLVNKQLKVHSGSRLSKLNLATTLPNYKIKITHSEFVQMFSLNKKKTSLMHISINKNINNGISLRQNKESLGSLVYNIFTLPGHQDQLTNYYQQKKGCSIATWVVPPGQYFMIGDNRDNSDDSRYWGFVPETNLVGKATAIWMSFDRKKGQWLPSLRFNRIGSIY